MTETSAKQAEIQAIVSDKILAYLHNKGMEVSALGVDEDLIAKGVLDSFDSIAVIAELEDTFNTIMDFSDDKQEDFKMSVASLSKMVSR